MLDHIAKLKKQRSKIIASFRQISRLGTHSPEQRVLLMSTIELLIIHLEDQRNLFYPAVMELLDVETDTQSMIKHFENEISLIREEAIRICNRLMSSNSELEFRSDFNVFFTGLQLRFIREEQKIFNKVEQLLTIRYINIACT